MKSRYEIDGKNLAQIAAEFGFSASGVHNRLRREGVKMRRGGIPPIAATDPTSQKMAVSFQATGNTSHVAREFGVSRTTVRRRLGALEAAQARQQQRETQTEYPNCTGSID